MEADHMEYFSKKYRRDCLLWAVPSTWDFILSQGSANAALFIWLAASAVCAGRLKTEE